MPFASRGDDLSYYVTASEDTYKNAVAFKHPTSGIRSRHGKTRAACAQILDENGAVQPSGLRHAPLEMMAG
jgi:hypothetical protein